MKFRIDTIICENIHTHFDTYYVNFSVELITMHLNITMSFMIYIKNCM